MSPSDHVTEIVSAYPLPSGDHEHQRSNVTRGGPRQDEDMETGVG